MKNIILTVIMAATTLIAATLPTAQANAASPIAAAQPPLTAWKRGDKTAAVSSFLAADWSARPLFATGSPLNLSEAQFKALSETERQAKSTELLSQIASLKQMMQAVAQAGQDAASKGDPSQARKYFTAIKQCGTALESSDFTQLVQLVGKAFVKKANAELAKVGQ